ncbi:MAG: phosphoribosylformylglycinamidine synthase I [Planctomycetota bacterium]|nr:phosphoribosylformylglycinamidine synthase I [Planctomycetota bacterium]
MSTPKVVVIRAAGTNCDAETAHAFLRFGAEAQVLHVNRLLEDPSQLHQHHILAVPGGFAYGDDVAAGAVLAAEMGTRLADDLVSFVANGGLVLGICNGFQVLVQLGLLPGLSAPLGKKEIALTDNASHKYEDRWVHLSVASRKCVFVGDMPAPHLPVAHAEGRAITLNEEVAQQLQDADRVVFRYANAEGNPTQSYPENPNGSQDAIAGLTDETGRVLGLMPHPERALFGFHHPAWTKDGRQGAVPDLGAGAPIFENACDWVRQNL